MCDPSLLSTVSTLVGVSSMFKKPPKVPEPPKPTAITAAQPKARKPPGTSTVLTGSSGLLAGSQNVGTNTLLGQ